MGSYFWDENLGSVIITPNFTAPLEWFLAKTRVVGAFKNMWWEAFDAPRLTRNYLNTIGYIRPLLDRHRPREKAFSSLT